MTRPIIAQDWRQSATGVQPLYRIASAASGFLSGLLAIGSEPEGRIEQIGHRSAADIDQNQEDSS